MRGLGYFIAKSNNGGLILSGIHPKRYFVCNPITKQLVRLPPPPMYFGQDVVMAILSPEEESLNNTNTGERMRCFRVIQAKVDYGSGSGSVPIQTFSSSTGRWEPSMLACSVSFHLERHVVKVIGDVVYWAASSGRFQCIAAYDTSKKNQDNIGGRISLSKIPEFFFEQGTLPVFDGSDDDGREMMYDLYECYGESPKGFLLYAACSRTIVNIWVLDHQTDFDDASSSSSSDHQHLHGWSFWQRVDLNSMWVWLMKNSGALGFKINSPKIRQFVFISFVPGRSDSVFVRLNKQLFIYHLDSKELERIHHYLDRGAAAYRFPKGNGLFGLCFHTLTMTELGAWPCSPSSSIFHEKKGMIHTN